MEWESADLEEHWRQKSDKEVAKAAAHLADYTEEAKQIIHAEMRRRGLPEPLPAVSRENKLARQRKKGIRFFFEHYLFTSLYPLPKALQKMEQEEKEQREKEEDTEEQRRTVMGGKAQKIFGVISSIILGLGIYYYIEHIAPTKQEQYYRTRLEDAFRFVSGHSEEYAFSRLGYPHSRLDISRTTRVYTWRYGTDQDYCDIRFVIKDGQIASLEYKATERLAQCEPFIKELYGEK